jgi:hypothetical protein
MFQLLRLSPIVAGVSASFCSLSLSSDATLFCCQIDFALSSQNPEDDRIQNRQEDRADQRADEAILEAETIHQRRG